jgi:putative oxidoreductase
VTRIPDTRIQSIAHNALRIVLGLTFFSHGAQKMLGWFGGFGPNAGTAELMSRFGAAGVIETVTAVFIIFGLWTRVFAFIASGEMAVTFFWMHVARAGSLYWWVNHGELPIIYCFVWFLIAMWGAGSFSVDGWLAKRRASP